MSEPLSNDPIVCKRHQWEVIEQAKPFLVKATRTTRDYRWYECVKCTKCGFKKRRPT